MFSLKTSYLRVFEPGSSLWGGGGVHCFPKTHWHVALEQNMESMLEPFGFLSTLSLSFLAILCFNLKSWHLLWYKIVSCCTQTVANCGKLRHIAPKLWQTVTNCGKLRPNCGKLWQTVANIAKNCGHSTGPMFSSAYIRNYRCLERFSVWAQLRWVMATISLGGGPISNQRAFVETFWHFVRTVHQTPHRWHCG
jgi:hypothetical protein